jgi:hypothetical protein
MPKTSVDKLRLEGMEEMEKIISRMSYAIYQINQRMIALKEEKLENIGAHDYAIYHKAKPKEYDQLRLELENFYILVSNSDYKKALLYLFSNDSNSN